MMRNNMKFDVPVLGQDTKDLYRELYGADGEYFIQVLSDSPNEIAVLSKMIAFLNERKGA